STRMNEGTPVFGSPSRNARAYAGISIAGRSARSSLSKSDRCRGRFGGIDCSLSLGSGKGVIRAFTRPAITTCSITLDRTDVGATLTLLPAGAATVLLLEASTPTGDWNPGTTASRTPVPSGAKV